MSNFERLSQEFLLKLLQEPGGFSFFPSSFFWGTDISQNTLHKACDTFFQGLYQEHDHRLNLYIHIPFCSRICSYCNCFKIYSNTSDEIDEYIGFLEKEIQIYYEKNSNKKIAIHSLFIGGGTPNVLSVSQFQRLFDIVYTYFDISSLKDFLIDCHPNHLDTEKIDIFETSGVTRVTLAIQSLDSQVLAANNRDSYDIHHIESLIEHIKTTTIKINIDLLIGLKGQDFESVKHDIDYFNGCGVDNISDHFFMLSNNLCYTLPDDYLDTVMRSKQYISEVGMNATSSNIQEDDYSSKKSSLLSIGAYGVTSIFSSIIFQKPNIQEYYKAIKKEEIPFYSGSVFDRRDEQIKYIYLNILSGIHVDEFYHIFQENIFEVFPQEMRFLYEKGIISKKDNILFPNKNDLETFTYLGVFFLDFVKTITIQPDSVFKRTLASFFLENGNLIDR